MSGFEHLVLGALKTLFFLKSQNAEDIPSWNETVKNVHSFLLYIQYNCPQSNLGHVYKLSFGTSVDLLRLYHTSNFVLLRDFEETFNSEIAENRGKKLIKIEIKNININNQN